MTFSGSPHPAVNPGQQGEGHNPTVVGLDLSLTATGIAVGLDAWTFRCKLTDTLRLARITGYIADTLTVREPALVCIEGPSYGSTTGSQHERGGLWWMVAAAIDELRIPRATVTPSALKKYATGKGNAGKDEMMVATCRRFPHFDGDNNAADALWLAAVAADHLDFPLVDMPAINRAALDKVQWPEVAR